MIRSVPVNENPQSSGSALQPIHRLQVAITNLEKIAGSRHSFTTATGEYSILSTE